ncbi:MBL fold metallo-hydrolase [Saccharopolyspora taberi]|uniref:MBL fold metallo-hydrolase n=1 Tax=Saccharopolyspora taberi TaxID=60895 RepID=A0ABN3V809_9PSEU
MDVVEVLPHLHMFRFAVGQAYLWRDGTSLTLIDTGLPGSGPEIAEAVRGLGHDTGDIARIVLTHFHQDHVGSAAEVRSWHGAPVLAHEADAPIIRGERPGPPPVLADWEKPLFESVASGLPEAPPTPVDRELADSEVLDFGGGARVLLRPGHTDGSIAIHLPAHQVLFTGDTIANVQHLGVGVFNLDTARTVESFRDLSELDTEIACFGHGDPIIGGAGAALRAAVAAMD